MCVSPETDGETVSVTPTIKPKKTDNKIPQGPSRLGLATLFGVILAPLACIVVFRAEILLRSADLASISLTFPGVWVLLGMLIVRMFYKKVSRRAMLLVYATVAATIGICTMGMVQFLITTILAPWQFATANNRFDQFWSHIPSWVAPRGEEVMKGFWLGNANLYDPAIWRAWVVPMLAWGGFLLALLAAQYCLAHLFYPRWSREERLTFPIVQLPLMLTEPGGVGKKALLLGAGVAIVLQGMSALNFIYPWIPAIRTLPTEFGQYLPQSMASMRPLYIAFYPCVIGLSALVPTNILYSCVFCFWLVKLENLGGSLAGLEAGGMGFPYPAEQGQGAVLAFALIVLWSARRSLKSSLISDQDRGYWITFTLAMAVLVTFGVALGMRPLVSIMLFGLFMLFMIGGGWVRAAVGMVWNPGNDVGWFPRTFLGAGSTIPEGVGMAYTRWFSFGDFRAHALPTYADTMRISESGGIDRKQLVSAIAIASVLSIIASLWCALPGARRLQRTTSHTRRRRAQDRAGSFYSHDMGRWDGCVVLCRQSQSILVAVSPCWIRARADSHVRLVMAADADRGHGKISYAANRRAEDV